MSQVTTMTKFLPPADEAKLKLVSVFMQTLFYGVFVVLVAFSVWLFRKNPISRSRMGNVMLAILGILFAFTSMHLSVNFTRIIQGFIIFGNDIGGPNAFFNKTSEFTNVFACAIYVFQTVFGELFFVHRSALIWGRQWWVAILPTLFFITSTLAGIGNIDAFIHVTAEKIFTVQHTHWKFFFAFAFSGNFIASGLIAYKLWVVNAPFSDTGLKRVRRVFLLMIDSGAAYAIILFVLFVVHETTLTTQYLLLDAFSPTLGITIALMFLRLSSGLCTIEGKVRAPRETDKKHYLGDVTLVASAATMAKGEKDSV